MRTMTTRGSLLAAGLVTLAVTLGTPARTTADDEGCAEATLRPHLDRLEEWSVAAFQVAPSGGARIVMDLEDGGRTLLIAMVVDETGVNTFQMSRGKEGDSSLAPEVSERLTAMYREIGEDKAVLACERLQGAPPPPDQVYAELEDLFRSLYESSESAEGRGGVSVTLLVVVAAVVLVLAGIILARIRRRHAAEPAVLPDGGAVVPPADDPAIPSEGGDRPEDAPADDEDDRPPTEPPTNA